MWFTPVAQAIISRESWECEAGFWAALQAVFAQVSANTDISFWVGSTAGQERTENAAAPRQGFSTTALWTGQNFRQGTSLWMRTEMLTRILLSFFITILWTPDCRERSLHPLPNTGGIALITDSHRAPIPAREHTERLTTSQVTAQSNVQNQLWVNCCSKLFLLVWPGVGPQLYT